ncbi:hypothetical protein THASP1DRAFT_31650 [Thamnocephalis sphaerospora]|uniref:Uncharacterized protein n=1 Tax=Thamnocephalis sphaerospora TaxID=78915 RepID=A0A4P9XL68_9FUNG|nr:hypothetical protein THASP1DRAFT_31650 [Thamnocephalis sphaerospora]|eukprot:RKP06532.1 hypothetical protein THASP1DRAFT_31650 [Thamnocephalis sphaerospora]
MGILTLWLASVLIHAILLEKAYTVTRRSRRVLMIGGLLLAPTPFYVYLGIWHGYADITDAAVCAAVFPVLQPLFKLLMDTAINLVLSIVFLRVVLRQYLRFGRHAWGRLLDDGIVTMLAIIASNFIAVLSVCLNILGPFSQFILYADFCMTTFLLIRQLERMAHKDADDRHLRHNPRCSSAILLQDSVHKWWWARMLNWLWNRSHGSGGSSSSSSSSNQQTIHAHSSRAINGANTT